MISLLFFSYKGQTIPILQVNIKTTELSNLSEAELGLKFLHTV